MKIGGHDFHGGKSGGTQPVGDPASGALDVRLVLALGADAGDAQKLAKLGEMLIALALDKFSKVRSRGQGRFLSTLSAF
jgi:hypothetical protein